MKKYTKKCIKMQKRSKNVLTKTPKNDRIHVYPVRDTNERNN